MTVEAIADLLEENSMAAALDMEIMAMAVSVVEVLVVNSKKIRGNIKTTVLTISITLLSVTDIWAYNFKVGDLCYNIIDKGTKTVEVTYEQESLEDNYSYLSGVVTIPITVTYNEW